jgi:hypothetical protein
MLIVRITRSPLLYIATEQALFYMPFRDIHVCYMAKSDSLHPHQTGVKIRNTRGEDIPKIVNLQRE